MFRRLLLAALPVLSGPFFWVLPGSLPASRHQVDARRTTCFGAITLFKKETTVMTTTELGACEWFVWDLRRSNLIDRGQLDQLVGEYFRKHPRPEPPGLAQFLVEQGILTQFQAERLLQGKTQGLVMGPYTLMESLGAGSMGTVYKAISKNDNQAYAIKVLPRRSMWNVRIARRQVRAFEQCQHPAVVPFVDVGTAGGTHYLAWPLVEGETLEAIVHRQGKLAPGLAAYYALQTAEGLDVCHQKDMIHGLLKPSNLMVGSDQQIHILDFGIGSLLANTEGESLVDTMSTANSLTSGLDCASPESIMEPTNRTAPGDQYSLGCVLYFSLTGKYPFPDGTAVDKMMAHQTKKPQPIRELSPDVPQGLVDAVDRLMAKTPEARFSRTGEVIEALRSFAQSPGSMTPRAPLRAPRPQSTFPSNSNPAASGHAPDWTTPAAPFTAPRALPVATPVPTRDSLRGSEPAQPPPTANGVPAAAPIIRRPAMIPIDTDVPGSLEERVGPVGIFVGAIMAACLTWVVSLWLFK
jgi:serine/threonine-protein kinase